MISGKTAYAKVDGVEIAGVTGWEATESVQELDASTGDSDGYSYTEGGLQEIEVTVNLLYFVGETEYTPISAGAEVEGLQLFETEDSPVPAFDIPFGIVLRSTRKAEVRGRLEVTFVVKNQGPYTVGETLE